MGNLIECVPNFSEGRDSKKIAQIVKAIEQRSVKLLEVEPDKDYNRTVVTFAGGAEEVKEAAFEAIKAASELIDMSKHKGQHPRLGATDVCPFIPISARMEDCVRLAKELGKRVGKELGIPVYLYGEAATVEERKELSHIRKGEYEGLKAKLNQEEWKPDYGPAEFNSRTGAVTIGARPFLIAFNVNLNTNDIKLANDIASRVRESGRVVDGERVPGSLKCVKALGVLLKDHGLAQVSMNLTNYKVTGLHKAFDEVRREAEHLGYGVTSSEIVGLVPKEALVEAGRYWAEKRRTVQLSEAELIQEAVAQLGLHQLNPFDPEKKVLEYSLGI